MEQCCERNKRIGWLLAGIGIAGAITLYAFKIRKYQARWGATDEELKLPLPGDDIVKDPTSTTTNAVTIHAAPKDIWPWLVQIGKGRGGLYSYDWLDILFGYLDRPSVKKVLPEFQNPMPGDVIPIGKDETTDDDFYVHSVEKERAFVIGSNHPSFRDRFSWAMILVPLGPRETRLIVRCHARMDRSLKGTVSQLALEPAAFIMIRRQMLNFKRLAEASLAKRVHPQTKRSSFERTRSSKSSLVSPL